jgi:hypothetical protein
MLALLLLALILCWGHRPKPPGPKPTEPKHGKRRDPHEPLHYDQGSPAERWLYGDDFDKKDDESG